MPELAEVEKLRRQLAPALVGRSVVYSESFHEHPTGRPVLQHLLRRHTLPQWEKAVHGQPLQALSRIGKNLCFEYPEAVVQCHLNATGWFFPANAAAQAATQINPSYKAFIKTAINKGDPFKYALYGWTLADGQNWMYCDPRMFGRLYVWTRAEIAANAHGCDLGLYGPDWLYQPEAARKALTNWRPQSPRLAQAVLLDQRITAGIGNYQAIEHLFRAGVHPHTPWNQTPPQAKAALAQSAVDFQPAALAATDHAHWCAFGKKGAPCPVCGTPITYNSGVPGAPRGAYWCPHCQPNPTLHPLGSARGYWNNLRPRDPAPAIDPCPVLSPQTLMLTPLGLGG